MKKKRPPLFIRTRNWLRKEYPLPTEVSVHRHEGHKMPKLLGYVEFDDDHLKIVIRKNTNQREQSETLIEEWSHAIRDTLAMPVDYTTEAGMHDEFFWMIYGRLINEWRDLK